MFEEVSDGRAPFPTALPTTRMLPCTMGVRTFAEKTEKMSRTRGYSQYVQAFNIFAWTNHVLHFALAACTHGVSAASMGMMVRDNGETPGRLTSTCSTCRQGLALQNRGHEREKMSLFNKVRCTRGFPCPPFFASAIQFSLSKE